MLFAEKEIDEGDARTLLRKLSHQAILTASAERLDEAFTLEEVLDVMENLPIGKQAGPNRVPNAVYKYMSRFFAPKLCAVLNEASTNGRLPKHFLEGDIAMLYKKRTAMTHATTARSLY